MSKTIEESILDRAADILGSREEAIEWMNSPAMALDQRRPVNLIGSEAGVKLVHDHLTRLDYCVYT